MSQQTRTKRSRAVSHIGMLALLLAPALPACQMARMELPETLATAERMPVEGRQGLQWRQRVRFGPYDVHQLRRSWTRGRDRGGPDAVQRDRRQEYSFTLREAGADRWTVSCLSSLRTLSIDVHTVEIRPEDESALYCNLQSLEDPDEAWELELQERHERPLTGTLSRGAERLQVVGTNRAERSLPLGSTTGYELREAGQVIGAVEVINNGAVWLPGGLEPERRTVLSAASAALLLLEELREDLD